jgi:hypothetical protein
MLDVLSFSPRPFTYAHTLYFSAYHNSDGKELLAYGEPPEPIEENQAVYLPVIFKK